MKIDNTIMDVYAKLKHKTKGASGRNTYTK